MEKIILIYFFFIFQFPIFADTPSTWSQRLPECQKKIEFKDYSIKEIFKGKSKELNLKSVKEKKLHFFLGLKPRKYKSPDFAGHFKIIEGGCGTMCTSYVAIDIKDGEPFDLGIAASLGIRYKKDSSLIIMNPEDEVEKWMTSGDVTPVDETVYFNWVDFELKSICVKKFQKK